MPSAEVLAGFLRAHGLQLNAQQQAAVGAVEGAVLLLAVPGSGKTTVLVTRLGYLVQCCNVRPEEILTMTYTVAATRDMRSRFSSLFGEELGSQMEFRTINGVSARIIRAYEQRMGRTAFSLLSSEAEQTALLRVLYFRCKGEYPTDAELKQARTLIAYAKNQMLGKEELDLLWKELDCFPALYRAYQQALRNARQMDYDDQMVYALRILRQVPEILHEFQARYHYFCVDEAQDTSRIQHAIVSLLAGAGGNLFLVGDEDQSIYGFRAACPDMLLHFEADHPGAKVLFLEQNYRSTPQIVEAADRFIRQNVSRRDKHMQPVRSGGAAIRQIPLNRRERQYTYLLEVARDLPENTAVLYRDHDSALPLIDLLERNGVPYRAKQTDGTFFSSRIVRDITDIIRFAQSPWDGALFRRIYYKFCAGIPKAVAERAAAHNPTAEPLLLAVADDDVSPYTRRQCRMLQTHLQNLRTEKANRAVYRIVAFMGYGDYLDQCGADKSRAEILEALGAQEPDPLRLLERLDELQALLRQPKSEARGLILSTVHSSKGLEYDRVFLLDVIDGVFPKEGEDVDRDEERRLFYVAMSRARNELAVFTFPPEKTSSAFSQFLFRPKRRIPRKSKKKTAADSFLPGTPVQHSAYGAGRILAREGDRVRIRFSSGSERVFSLAAAVPNGLLSLRQESGGNAAKTD